MIDSDEDLLKAYALWLHCKDNMASSEEIECPIDLKYFSE